MVKNILFLPSKLCVIGHILQLFLDKALLNIL